MLYFFQHFICNVWILCHIMFFLLFVMFVMFGCYIKERKKTEKWRRGVNWEEEMREKNEMGEGGCKYVVGEKKKKRQGVHGWWGKKKKKWGVGFTCMVEKKGSRKERRKKNLKGQKLNWFYLYVHFVWCQV